MAPENESAAQASPPGWHRLSGGPANVYRFWNGQQWTDWYKEVEDKRSLSTGATLAVLAAVITFAIGGITLLGTQAAARDSIFEPLLHGIGWISLGAAASLIALVAIRR